MRLCLVLLLVFAAPAGAGGLRDLDAHVRTTDGFLRALVRDATRTSPSFRTLIARLVRSDVVVYVTRERIDMAYVDASTSFLSAAGGVRYLAIRISPALSPRQLVAMVAHELQHAVEVADAPWVIDDESMAREYTKLGMLRLREDGTHRTFDSQAAILAGERAWLEYGRRSSVAK